MLPGIKQKAKLQLMFGNIIHLKNETQDEIKYFYPKNVALDKTSPIDINIPKTVISDAHK